MRGLIAALCTGAVGLGDVRRHHARRQDDPVPRGADRLDHERHGRSGPAPAPRRPVRVRIVEEDDVPTADLGGGGTGDRLRRRTAPPVLAPPRPEERLEPEAAYAAEGGEGRGAVWRPVEAREDARLPRSPHPARAACRRRQPHPSTGGVTGGDSRGFPARDRRRGSRERQPALARPPRRRRRRSPAPRADRALRARPGYPADAGRRRT